jgi:5-methylcytosine-specific restriction endonuclease McrA
MTMKRCSLKHLASHVLLQNLRALVAREREVTAEVLAHIAEVDARKLYLAEGYPSMFAYCVGELGFSEDATYKRTQAARAAQEHPAILDALAEGRLHLSAVCLLAPHLTPENAEKLLADATHKTKAQIERLLAERFPKPDVPARIEALLPVASAVSPAPGQVQGTAKLDIAELAPAPVETSAVAPGPAAGNQPAPGQVDPPALRPKLTPLAPQRFAVQFTMDQEAHDELRYLQALLGHTVPSGDLAEVFRLAVKAHIEKLEKRIFAATSRPRPGRRSKDVRHVPAAVKREVWERDGGQCAFTSDKGHRCEARTRLQYDHVEPVARGGCATVAGMRLLCRAHNQHAADCAFGKGFMDGKRKAARHSREEARARRGTAAALAQPSANSSTDPSPAHTRADAEALTAAALEVVPWLREMNCRSEEARGGGAQAVKASPVASP